MKHWLIHFLLIFLLTPHGLAQDIPSAEPNLTINASTEIPTTILQHTPASKKKLIMINPDGHAKYPGRKLAENYERAETYKCAETLQRMLQERYSTRVVFTRVPGEEIVHLQNASFANRFNADLFINLHLYKEDTEKPKVYLYYLVYNSIHDFAPPITKSLSFTPIHHAHISSLGTTVTYAQAMAANLSTPSLQKQFDFAGPFGLPIKPLAGIANPALALEIGINSDQKWQDLILPLVESLSFFFK